MIFYGSKATAIGGETLYEVACPHCGTKGETEAVVYARYAHVYWIPIFSMGKKAACECKHCLRTFVEGKDARALQPAFNELKARAKVPIWHWAGAALIGVSIIASSISGGENDKKRAQFVAQPEVGDVYHIKMTDGNYSTMKVRTISADSVEMFMNTLSVNKLSGIGKLEASTNYTDTEVGSFAKTDLKSMLEKHEIVEIKR
jgi:hypothetical protein